MALPSSGTISINDIVQMFGGVAPHGLSEYYKNGTYVLNTDTVPNVPTSGTIKLSDFYGAEIVESYVSPLTAGNARNIEYYSAESVVSLEVNTSGDVVGNGNLLDFTKDWLNGTPRSTYQVRFTKVGDTTNGAGYTNIIGTFDTWLSLNAIIEVTAIANNGVNCKRTVGIKVEVRRLVDGVVVSTSGASMMVLIAESKIGLTP